MPYTLLSVSGGSFFKGVKIEIIQQLTIADIKNIKENLEE